MKKLLILTLVLAVSSLGYAVSDDFSSYTPGSDLHGQGLWNDYGSVVPITVSTGVSSGSYSANSANLSIGNECRMSWTPVLDATTHTISYHINIQDFAFNSFQVREDAGGGNYLSAVYMNSDGRWNAHGGNGTGYSDIGGVFPGWQTITHSFDFAAQTFTWSTDAGSGLSYSGAINFDAGEPDITAANHTRFYIEGSIEMDYIEATPEPITIALLGLGGLFLRRRR